MINVKTKSLYVGCYDFEDKSHSNWIHFAYSSNADDEELEAYFRDVVYKSEYGENLDADAQVDIYEFREAFDYTSGRSHRVALETGR